MKLNKHGEKRMYNNGIIIIKKRVGLFQTHKSGREQRDMNAL